MKLITALFVLFFYAQAIVTNDFTYAFQHAQSLILHNQYEHAYEALKALIPLCSNSQEKRDVGNALLQVGLHFFDTHESARSLDAFSTLLEISDRLSVAHHNIGFVYTEQLGLFTRAIPAFEKALALQHDNAATHFCYALALLSNGELKKGFKEYQWRWHRGSRSPRNFATYPLDKQWCGKNLAGKTIFLRAEQGLGDTLHFIRYAEVLHLMGARVIAEVQEPLKPLLTLCPYLHSVITIREPAPAFDFQIPYLDIPKVVQTTLESIPSNVPYLFAKPELMQKWHAFFSKQKGTFNVGICWHGDSAHSDDKFMPITGFAELAKVPGVKLFSLQKNGDNDDEDIILFPLHFFDKTFDTTVGSFMDTAAIMRNLDLVITVDTSIAHLAGGLGVPVWVALPFPAEWRWLTERSDSVWYPTMRLFRQLKRNNWKPVIAQIKHELTQLACKFE